MKCLKSPFSLLPSQSLGMRSLIRCGLEAAGFADTFCSAVLMLLNTPILPLTVSFMSVRTKPAVVTMPVHDLLLLKLLLLLAARISTAFERFHL